MREKSKDIVALLTDENLLADARRNKNPPQQRRPLSTGPLTIESDGKQMPRSTDTGLGQSYPRLTSSRRSFEDLQNVDEDAALALALQQSKAEYEGSRDLLDNRFEDDFLLLVLIHLVESLAIHSYCTVRAARLWPCMILSRIYLLDV